MSTSGTHQPQPTGIKILFLLVFPLGGIGGLALWASGASNSVIVKISAVVLLLGPAAYFVGALRRSAEEKGRAPEAERQPGEMLAYLGFGFGIFLSPIGVLISLYYLLSKGHSASRARNFAIAGLVIGLIGTAVGIYQLTTMDLTQ